MTWEIALTFSVLVAVVGGLTLTRVSPDMVLLGGLAILMVGGVVTPVDAFRGFGNEGVVTIAALFVVAEGLRQTGGLNFIGQRALGRPKTIGSAQLRLMAPVAALSAFLNNTPVVAMTIPIVSDWARRNGHSVTKLLLPLSYASILGGLITLVGTSTTLVVNGLLLGEPTLRGLTMFEMGWVGIPIAVVGILYMPAASRWLLPDRLSARRQIGDPREYTIEMIVEDSSPIVGKTIEDAGLRALPGTFLAEIQRRDGSVVAAVGPRNRLDAGDRLVFVGAVDSVVDLQKIPGLAPATEDLHKILEPRSHRCLIEAVVGGNSRLAGRTIRDSKFRTRYNAVVIAVAREGERVKGKVGDIRLGAGDTLLIEAHPSFAEVQRNSRDFILVSKVEDSTPMAHERAWIARVIIIVMVAIVAAEVTSMLKAACVAGAAMVLTRCLRVSQAKRAIDWSVLLAVGAGIGIGVAMDNSGAAKLVAASLLGVVGDSPILALIAIYGLTTVLANLITTQAAAVLVFPIALATSVSLGVNFMPFAICLIVAAASAFATPIGYQTNLMVYGPGGYRGIDFLRVGGPLSLIAWIMAVTIAPMVWGF